VEEEKAPKKPSKHQLKMMARQQEKDAKKPKGKAAGPSKKKSKAIEKEKVRAELSKRAFNDFYVSQFGADRWTPLYKALERQTRYCCMINKYATKKSVDDALGPIMHKYDRKLQFSRATFLLYLTFTSI
jgi:phage gp36-like protein